jgi:polyphosphate kinase 2 (PPK2 family)
MMDEALIKTDTDYAPWTIVEATDREFAIIKILSTTVEDLTSAVNQVEKMKLLNEKESNHNVELDESRMLNQFKNGVLNGINLNLTLEKEEYKEKLKKLQERISILHNEMYRNRIPVILAFEGWDAAGKGGAIKRITEQIDPRGYEVIPVAAPNDIERAHHYLWRFWKNIPKAGHLAIFDRTWYGIVMVERIEGFCKEEEWKRAFNEINQMEEHLANADYIILKFWLHIDKDEQEKRFKERQENPEKQWKITEEDWRNREKWSAYEEAVDEMIVRTSTHNAPWIIVEANSKYYARIKVLETVVNALEQRLKETKKKDK